MHEKSNKVPSGPPSWSARARASCDQTGLDLDMTYMTLIKAYLRTRAKRKVHLAEQVRERR